MPLIFGFTALPLCTLLTLLIDLYSLATSAMPRVRVDNLLQNETMASVLVLVLGAMLPGLLAPVSVGSALFAAWENARS